MLLTPYQNRLIAQCPALRQVLNALSAAVPTAYPSAYLVPLSERVSESDYSNILRVYEARFGVEIMARNVADAAAGGAAAGDLETLRESVLAALVGFDAGDGYSPVAHVAGKLISFEAGLAIWRDEFSVTFTR